MSFVLKPYRQEKPSFEFSELNGYLTGLFDLGLLDSDAIYNNYNENENCFSTIKIKIGTSTSIFKSDSWLDINEINNTICKPMMSIGGVNHYKMILKETKEKEIRKIYIGITKELEQSIFWINREYRTHPFSHIEGGTDVVVEYHDKDIFGYDWIKKPSKYVKAIFLKKIEVSHEDFSIKPKDLQLDEVKDNIIRIFTRKSEASDSKTEILEEIWNHENASETSMGLAC